MHNGINVIQMVLYVAFIFFAVTLGLTFWFYYHYVDLTLFKSIVTIKTCYFKSYTTTKFKDNLKNFICNCNICIEVIYNILIILFLRSYSFLITYVCINHQFELISLVIFSFTKSILLFIYQWRLTLLWYVMYKCANPIFTSTLIVFGH